MGGDFDSLTVSMAEFYRRFLTLAIPAETREHLTHKKRFFAITLLNLLTAIWENYHIEIQTK